VAWATFPGGTPGTMLWFLLSLILGGLVLGALARLALPGPDPMTVPQTILLGIGGSLIAGLVVYAISGGRYVAGFLGAFTATFLLLYIIRRRRGGSLTRPAPRA
jgi:uncharacterized membrane protein YeaQ/YmgE (transglycosylase-associated protein family)